MHFLYFFTFKNNDADGVDRCVKVGITAGSKAIDLATFTHENDNKNRLLLTAAYFRLKEICDSLMRGYIPKIKFCIEFENEDIAYKHEQKIFKLLRRQNLQEKSLLPHKEYFKYKKATFSTVYDYFINENINMKLNLFRNYPCQVLYTKPYQEISDQESEESGEESEAYTYEDEDEDEDEVEDEDEDEDVEHIFISSSKRKRKTPDRYNSENYKHQDARGWDRHYNGYEEIKE